MSTIPSKDKDFANKLATTVEHGFTTVALGLGYSLGLFKILANFKEPVTSQDIATAGNCKERYIREWLGAMVTSGIVEVDDPGTQFFLPREHIQALTENGAPVTWAYGALLWSRSSKVVEDCFPTNGPKGVSYSDYQCMDKFFDVWDSMTPEERMGDIVGKVPSLKSSLESGINVLEIGCCNGKNIHAMAKLFPGTTITGLDIAEDSIEQARYQFAKDGLTNTSFIVCDACKLPPDWSNKFDYVLIIDTLHDLPQPHKTLAEMYRVLKPGGISSVIEINLYSNMADNKNIPVLPPVLYIASLLYCMPTSLNSEEGEGRGAAWGKENITEALKGTGFRNVCLNAEKEGTLYAHFVCYK